MVGSLELNVGCPNVKNGLSFGTDPVRLAELVAAVRKQVKRCVLIVKLSPNVSDVAVTARAAVEAGADCLSLVNTFTAMVVDIEKGRPMLANGTGGLSGPAIKPIAVFMTHRVYTEVAKQHNIPIFGMGGIQSWQDAAEFLPGRRCWGWRWVRRYSSIPLYPSRFAMGCAIICGVRENLPFEKSSGH